MPYEFQHFPGIEGSKSLHAMVEMVCVWVVVIGVSHSIAFYAVAYDRARRWARFGP